MQTAHRKSLHFLKSFQSNKRPSSRQLIMELFTLSKIQDLENPTLFSSIYPYTHIS